MIKEYLLNNILLTDGAMGTYYSQLTSNAVVFSELANITDPDTIEYIHRQYIDAGARLIRTNTFSANTITLGISRDKLRDIITAGYGIAKKAASSDEIYIAADIGPIPDVKDNIQSDREKLIDEYKFIVDTFLMEGADTFVFETFSSTEYLDEITQYIKEKKTDAFIIVQFVIMPDGYTRKGISISRIVKEAKELHHIDAYGFNCGTGPAYLYNNLKNMDFTGDIVSVLPNAGFPEIINERTIYSQNEGYFADTVINISRLGVRIIGGCCGTTPAHIRKIAEKMKALQDVIQPEPVMKKDVKTYKKPMHNVFSEKLKRRQFTIAVELDPPSVNDYEKIMIGAKLLREYGADAITVADSPLAKARANSLVTASMIKRNVGIDVVPHICCRDRNIIALKADLLAAHMDGIRNILVVTGDPIPSAEKSEIKSVFNLNSLRLIEFINEMNKEIFAEDSYYIGGALNLNVSNMDAQISRMYSKAEAGACFFMTQPIYDDNVIEYLSKLKKPEHIKILGGIMPLVSYRNAQFLNNEVPGIRIPEKYINRFKEDMTREEGEHTGIEIAVEIAGRIKNYVDGFYFMTPFNRAGMIAEIIKQCI